MNEITNAVSVANTGVVAVAGKFADDPTLHDICGDIYAQRDLELSQAAAAALGLPGVGTVTVQILPGYSGPPTRA